jgi:hypothetical protein
MAKVKKFAEGKSVVDKFLDYATDKDTRSVMDMPKKDMRDPQYRKELEQKQALKEPDLSPEDIVIGPAKKAGAAIKAFSNARKAGRATPEIGSNVSRMVDNSPKFDPKYEGFGSTEEWMRYGERMSPANLAKEKAAFEKKMARHKKLETQYAANDVEREGNASFRNRVAQQQQKEMQEEMQKRKQAASGRGRLKRFSRDQIAPSNYGAAGNLAMEAEDQASGLLNKPETGYKKGGKVRSASARADGIAIRGKTRA